MVLQLMMMWGNFQVRSSLTCLRAMMTRNRLSLTTSMTPLLNLQHWRTLEVLQKVLPMLTMQMALHLKLQMTTLLNVRRTLLKVLPLTILEIRLHMTLLLNMQLMLLKVLPLRTLLMVLEIMVQWGLPRNLLASNGPMNCCLNCAALLSWRPGRARGKF